MSNSVFPALSGLAFPVTKTPTWRTDVQEAQSGKEVRIGAWLYPRWRWSLAYEFLRDKPELSKDELWALMGFYNKHFGSLDSWLFEDPDDKSVTAQPFGTGNGAQTQFQLVRTRGGFVEPVKELNGTPLIYKAGVLQTVTTHYTINSTGLVTFVTAPANGAALAWTGSFYWRCRFHEDEFSVEKFAQKLWEAGKVEFISVK
jgi:uncharacterized protein (TIGR02217 family)